MRHSEAWRLEAVGDIHLAKQQLVNPTYDADSYDEMPQYKWNENFSADSFGIAIETANAGYWNNTKAVVCQRVGMPFTYSGFAHYSTRRLRRQVSLSHFPSRYWILKIAIASLVVGKIVLPIYYSILKSN